MPEYRHPSVTEQLAWLRAWHEAGCPTKANAGRNQENINRIIAREERKAEYDKVWQQNAAKKKSAVIASPVPTDAMDLLREYYETPPIAELSTEAAEIIKQAKSVVYEQYKATKKFGSTAIKFNLPIRAVMAIIAEFRDKKKGKR